MTGRPRKEINEAQLRALCRMKPTKADCAAFFECSEDTIENRVKELGYPTFSVFREQNMVHTRFNLIRKAISMGESGNVPMLIFSLKNLCGWSDKYETRDVTNEKREVQRVKTFNAFCVDAGYPEPYKKQVEMQNFAINLKDPRLLLGARGYGKTDYLTILGVAYDVYLNPVESTNLIISKSKTRNTAILEEIATALLLNGVKLEKKNSTCIRVNGVSGKDHSIEALTIKGSFRGRHPKRIIMDDPVTEEDTSDAVRLLVKKKYDEAYKLSSNVLVIGQPAHAFDLYSELRPIIKKMEVPHGSIPELDADLEAMRLAGVDNNSIEMSYHLTIPKNSSSSFSEVNYIEKFPDKDSVAFIDPSFEGGDYTALTVLTSHFDGIAVQGHLWKMAWSDCLDQMCEKMRALKVGRVCFETNSLGSQPLGLLRSHDSMSGIGVIGKKSTTNKHSRIMAAGVFAKSIHLSQNSDKIYIDQVIKYEYKAKHDDAPDSLASCMEWVGLVRGK